MSVSTPILTTSSEICALAVPPDATIARLAASATASDLSWGLVERFFYPASDGPQSRSAVGVEGQG
jgi:hypothetical protein